MQDIFTVLIKTELKLLSVNILMAKEACFAPFLKEREVRHPRNLIKKNIILQGNIGIYTIQW